MTTRSNGWRWIAGMALVVGAMTSSPALAQGHRNGDGCRGGPHGSSERIERRSERLGVIVGVDPHHLALTHLELQLSLAREHEHRHAIRRRAMRHWWESWGHGPRGRHSSWSHWRHGWR